MRAKWSTTANNTEHLNIHTSGGWLYAGWIFPTTGGFNVLCCWMDGWTDYPENKIFETSKQARRALKASATAALIGGLFNNF